MEVEQHGKMVKWIRDWCLHPTQKSNLFVTMLSGKYKHLTSLQYKLLSLCRLVVEEDGPILYYNQQNSKVFQGKPIQGVSIDSEVRKQNAHPSMCLSTSPSVAGC